MKANRAALVPPFLVAAYVVIDLCAKNVDKVSFHETLRPLGISLLLAALFVTLSQLALRDRAKSCVYGTFLLTVTYSFVGLRSQVQKLIPALDAASVYHYSGSIATLILCVGIAVFVFLRLRKTKRDLNPLTRYLTVLAAVWLIFPTFRIAQFVTTSSSLAEGVNRWDAEIANECGLAGPISAPNPPPDIYYIILDMYARPDVLKESFGYDNSDFVDYLVSKGFYVAENSHSNYPFTHFSLASSLNSEYLADLDRYVNARGTEGLLNHMIRDNRVARLLKASGYKYVLVDSGWEVSGGSDLADLVLPSGITKITELERVLIKKSVFDIWWKGSVPYLRPYVMNCFSEMAKLPDIEGPKFVFAHFVCPHEPWLFDRNGNEPTDPATPGRPSAWRANYTDQVDYVNKRMVRLIDHILATSATPPVIIVQGDHGAFEPEFYQRWWTSKAARLSDGTIVEGFKPRMGILNAYYFPGDGRKALYPSITPVNSFRVMLNEYFGCHFRLLEDVSYIPKRGQSRNDMSVEDLRKCNPGALGAPGQALGRPH